MRDMTPLPLGYPGVISLNTWDIPNEDYWNIILFEYLYLLKVTEPLTISLIMNVPPLITTWHYEQQKSNLFFNDLKSEKITR